MNKKLTKDEVLRRAIYDFRYLIIYYNVIRPQYLPYFKVKGKFSIYEMKKQIFYGGKPMAEIKLASKDPNQLQQFITYQAHYNWTFGIPTKRIKQVLGFYRDNDGCKNYIHIDDVLPKVEEVIGHIEHKPHGEAWGKYSYCGKWLMDEQERDKYLKDKKWSDIYNAPGVSKRFIDLVNKWKEEDIQR